MAKPTHQYGLSKVQLSQIMDFGKGGLKKVEEYGGIEEIAVHLNTNLKDGLPPHEAELEARRREFGRNYIEPIPPKSFLALMFDALQDKVLLILLGKSYSCVYYPSLSIYPASHSISFYRSSLPFHLLSSLPFHLFLSIHPFSHAHYIFLNLSISL